ncbi:MAG: Fe-S cluster assembly protein SufD [Puia sp.]|nr:Fe-S cluster assembly protein SufD [Puia sp.]
MIKDLTIPLYGELENGFDTLIAAAGRAKEGNEVLKGRKTAFHTFTERGFPTIKNEDWKYTNITRFLKDDFAIQTPPANPSTGLNAYVHPEPVDHALVAGAGIESLDCYQLTLVNGNLLSADGASHRLPEGIRLITIAEAVQDPGLAACFGHSEESEKYHFTALNAALFSNGLFIEVKAGFSLDKPLHIIHVFTSGYNLLVQPRHRIVVNRNASVTIIESVVGSVPEAKLFVNSLTEIVLEADSKMDHYLVEMAGVNSRLVQHTMVSQKKNSVYNNYTFCLQRSDLLRNELHVLLNEEHTETNLYGLYLASGNQLVDNHTFVEHRKPNCYSNELYKGVLSEQSSGVFNGKIHVYKDAQKTNAFQQNNNLLMGRKATVDSKPQLEIYADDVKCSHGSTVGQFSDEALFYLRARGIGEETAKGLLINAFAFDVTEKIKIPELEAHVNKLISGRIF